MPCHLSNLKIAWEKKKKTERPSLNHKYTIKDELHMQLVCIATYAHQLQLIHNTANVACRRNI